MKPPENLPAKGNDDKIFAICYKTGSSQICRIRRSGGYFIPVSFIFMTMSPAEAYKRFRIPAYVLLILVYISWTNLPHIFRYGWPWNLYFPGHTVILLGTILVSFGILTPKYFRKEQYTTYFIGVFLLFLAGTGALYLLLRLLASSDTQGFTPLTKMPLPRIILGSLFSYGIEYWMLSLAKVAREWYKKYELIRKQQFEHMKEELRLLRAQLDPHFMFNTLNNIYLLVLNAAPEASGSVLLLSELLSYILYESSEEQVSLVKELEFIESYISLQQLRLDKTQQVILEKDGPLEGTVPPLILFNFIENAFKHAYGSFRENGHTAHIFISVQVQDNQLQLKVKNARKIAREDHQPVISRKGIGFSNTRKRLDLIYPGNYSLDINDPEDFYSVTLKLPAHVPALSDH